MTDDELETLLRGVRPSGPGAELRARVLRGGRSKPAWPWLAAAAALAALTFTLQTGAARLRDVPPASEAGSVAAEEDAAIHAAFGDDRAALAAARLTRDLDALADARTRQEAPPQ